MISFSVWSVYSVLLYLNYSVIPKLTLQILPFLMCEIQAGFLPTAKHDDTSIRVYRTFVILQSLTSNGERLNTVQTHSLIIPPSCRVQSNNWNWTRSGRTSRCFKIHNKLFKISWKSASLQEPTDKKANSLGIKCERSTSRECRSTWGSIS